MAGRHPRRRHLDSVPGILLSSLLGLLVSTIGAPVVAGLATAYTGAQALGRDGRGAVAERLTGRWPVLLGIAADRRALSSRSG